MVCGKNVNIHQAGGPPGASGDLGEQVRMNFALRLYGSPGAQKVFIGMRDLGIHPVFGEGRNRAWVCNYMDVEH